MAHAVEKLPKWAQQIISRLEARVKTAERRLEEQLESQAPTRVYSGTWHEKKHMGDHGVATTDYVDPPVYLREHREVTFELTPTRSISVRLTDRHGVPVLDIASDSRGSNQLVALPSGGCNRLEVTMPEFLGAYDRYREDS